MSAFTNNQHVFIRFHGLIALFVVQRHLTVIHRCGIVCCFENETENFVERFGGENLCAAFTGREERDPELTRSGYGWVVSRKDLWE